MTKEPLENVVQMVLVTGISVYESIDDSSEAQPRSGVR